jgi:hypothetical protein
MRWIVGVFAAAAVMSSGAIAQAQTVGTGAISGRVNDHTGEALPGVRVTVTGPDLRTEIITDEYGVFESRVFCDRRGATLCGPSCLVLKRRLSTPSSPSRQEASKSSSRCRERTWQIGEQYLVFLRRDPATGHYEAPTHWDLISLENGVARSPLLRDAGVPREVPLDEAVRALRALAQR